MGSSNWNDAEYRSFSSTRATKSVEQNFQSTSVPEHMHPRNIRVRESVDSEANPNSTPIILGLDVTGSMGRIANSLATKHLGRLVTEILARKPVSDPHLMAMAIGDIDTDRGPLQVTQFEADIRIAQQMTELWVEGNGGGNGHESYDLPWLFAAQRTVHDSWAKRSKKGYIFTFGDEGIPRGANRHQLQQLFGAGEWPEFMTSEQMLKMAQERYEVFHVILEEGGGCAGGSAGGTREVYTQWHSLIGHRAILCSNYHDIPEIVTSVIQVAEGADPENVLASWPDGVRQTVRHALFGEPSWLQGNYGIRRG